MSAKRTFHCGRRLLAAGLDLGRRLVEGVTPRGALGEHV